MEVGDEIIVIVTGNTLEGKIEVCEASFISQDPYNDKLYITLRTLPDEYGKCTLVGSFYLDDFTLIDDKHCLIKEL